MALSALAWPLAVAAQSLRWDMPNEYPGTSIHGEGDQFFARALSERSGGRVAITHHFDAALGYRSKDLLDAIGQGKVALGDMYVGALGGVDPIFLLPSLPFLAVTPAEARLLVEVARPAYEVALARHNQMLLYPSPWPPAGLWAKKPLTSLGDLLGLRVRTADGNATITMRAAGALPSQISFADALPLLKSGAIDAVLSSGDGGAGDRLMETLTHFTAVNYSMTMSMVTMNLDTWKGLPPDLQAAVRAAAEAASERQWKEIVNRVTANYARMRARGITIVTELSPEYERGLRAAGQVAVDEWLARMGPPGKDILDRYRARLATAPAGGATSAGGTR
jgi:TRAP-type C4-dicarboxylate transport system substrate-binding protein